MIKLTNTYFDYDLFLAEYERIQENEINYARGGGEAPYWKVIRDEQLQSSLAESYRDFIVDSYGIQGKTNISFYRLLANETLPWHTDTDTKCAFNFILNGEAAPVTYESGSYEYKQALIRTDIPHMVKNGNKDRILYKISIFDMSFDEVSILL